MVLEQLPGFCTGVRVVDVNHGENEDSYRCGHGAGQETYQENTHRPPLPLLLLGETMKTEAITLSSGCTKNTTSFLNWVYFPFYLKECIRGINTLNKIIHVQI